ncbi:ribosomal protein S18-alanine N-acetyltransferase [Agromyces lapidis]
MRRARLGDLDAIMRLERATFTDDAWPEDAMRRELESPHGYYLVAVDDELASRQASGEAGGASEVADGASEDRHDESDAAWPPLLGYAGLLAPSGGDQGDIQTIAVDPAARGIGLGRGLMHALITESRRRGVAQLFLEVRSDNPIARSLYESLGFVEIGVRRGYYRHGVDAIMMQLAVPPAVTRPAGSADGTTIGGAAR